MFSNSSFQESTDCFIELTSLDLGEGNQAMVESNKLIVFQNLVFCVPMIGYFKICSIESPKIVKLYTESNLLNYVPPIEDISSKSESVSMSSEASEIGRAHV